MRIWGPSYGDHLTAEAEAKELAREATDGQTQEEDPAEERAESMTNAARAVVAMIVIVAMVVGTAWVLFSTTAALIAAGVAGLGAVALVVRRRAKKPEAAD
jgi:Flp pilus assembly protein TadB